jgi:WD40 repeat protein
LTGHERVVDGLAFTPDGKHLVSASNDDTVRLWPLQSGEQGRVLLAERLVFPELAMDPAGKFVVVSGRSNVFIVSLAGGASRELQAFSSDSHKPVIALGPEGRLLAAAPYRGPAAEKVIRIWDLQSGKTWTLDPLESAGDGLEGGYNSLKFLPDGRLVSDGYGGLHLWSLEAGHLKTLSREVGEYMVSHEGGFVLRSQSGERQGFTLAWFDLVHETSRALDSHGRTAWSLDVDPSGRLVVSGGGDGVVRVGPVTGEEPHLLFAHEAMVRSVAFSPDGRWVASGGSDGTILLWPMPDLDEPPLHTLPYEELLTRLRTMTNVRVVEDEASSTGFRIDYAPFPGWGKLPEGL